MSGHLLKSVLIAATVIGIAMISQGCGPRAALVIGQADFKSNFSNQNKEIAGSNALNSPGGSVAMYRDSLYITDSNNNRILYFSPIPNTNNPSAAGIIASSDPLKWTNFNEPFALGIADDRMFVADSGSNRVLIWNKVPRKDETPDIVLGQTDLTGPSVGDCAHMREPRGLVASNDKLIVSEMDNNRILIWNSIPGRTDANNPISADLALGNSDCSPDTAGSTRHTFQQPRSVWTDGTRLVVADTGNNRVLIWNRFPAHATDDADIMLGTGTAGSGQGQFNGPYAVASDGMRLFIADHMNNRILIWDKFPAKDGDLPSRVLGQQDFVHSGINGAPIDDGTERPPTSRTFFRPQGLYLKGDQLWISDTNNHRVVMYRIAPK